MDLCLNTLSWTERNILIINNYLIFVFLNNKLLCSRIRSADCEIYMTSSDKKIKYPLFFNSVNFETTFFDDKNVVRCTYFYFLAIF